MIYASILTLFSPSDPLSFIFTMVASHCIAKASDATKRNFCGPGSEASTSTSLTNSDAHLKMSVQPTAVRLDFSRHPVLFNSCSPTKRLTSLTAPLLDPSIRHHHHHHHHYHQPAVSRQQLAHLSLHADGQGQATMARACRKQPAGWKRKKLSFHPSPSAQHLTATLRLDASAPPFRLHFASRMSLVVVTQHGMLLCSILFSSRPPFSPKRSFSFSRRAFSDGA